MRTAQAVLFLVFLSVAPLFARPIGDLTFLSASRTVWLERTQVVPFRLADPAARDTRFTATVADPTLVAVIREPEVLEGELTGFLRVEGLARGTTTIEIDGAVLELSVEPVSEPASVNSVSVRIVGPASGAYVWGTVALGVEVTVGTGQPRDLLVRLRTAEGTEVEPEEVRFGGNDPFHRSRFSFDADGHAEGPIELTAICRTADGEEHESPAVNLNVIRDGERTIVAGECERYVDVERPEAYGLGAPSVGSHPDADAGEFVVCRRSDPSWILPIEIDETGRYQMMVRARGDFGAGAWPTVGLCIDDRYNATTAVRLAGRRWHRAPVGLPVTLEAGEHVLSLRFMNDVTIENTTDRNLFLDSFALIRIDDRGGDAAAGESMMMMSMTTSGGGDYGGGILRVGFDRALDGLPINGRLTIEGTCLWTGRESTPAPMVELMLNGTRVAMHQAASPIFALDRSAFEAGDNTLQLVARTIDGRYAETPLQTVHVSDPNPSLPARDLHRFSVLDDRWNDPLKATLRDEGEERVARLPVGTRAEIPLPLDLEGRYDVLLETRNVGRGATLAVSLDWNGANRPVGGANVNGWWNHREAGLIELPAGPKVLVVEIDASSLGGDSTDPGVLLRSVLLRTRRDDLDRRAPQVRIAYPAEGHEAFGVDAVVVEAWDDDERLQAADLLIDGRPQHTYGRIVDGAGYTVLPMILRDLAPGEHTFAVRVSDTRGNLGESREVSFRVLEQEPSRLGRYERAVTLLDRFAYGPASEDLAAILVQGEEAWLDERLAEASAGDEVALGGALAELTNAGRSGVRRAAMTHVLRTTNPVWARFGFFIDNHFSTWINKVEGPSEWLEHAGFLRMGPAPFGELLLASSTSPAMLRYLDQAESYAGQLNENYAREIMELHTLGVNGGYTQEDVTSLAGLLSGLTLSDEAYTSGMTGYMAREFRFDADLGDAREREILGVRFERTSTEERFDRYRLAIEVLAAHPSTARFVATKLCHHYVGVSAPEGLIDDIAAVFDSSGGDMRACLLAIARDERFFSAAAQPRITSPLEYAVRIGRVTGFSVTHWAINSYLERSGMALFDRATPDGWPEEDEAWADSNLTFQRWRLAREIPWAMRVLVPNELRRSDAGDVERWRQRVVDVCAVRLTGRLLGEGSNEAAVEYLASATGNDWEKVDQLTALVCGLPEASLK